MKYVGAIVTMVVVGFFGLIGLGVMLVALNGFSESDGGKSIAAYALAAFAITIASAAATPLVAKRSARLGRSAPALSATVAAIVFGCILVGIAGVGALFLATALDR